MNSIAPSNRLWTRILAFVALVCLAGACTAPPPGSTPELLGGRIVPEWFSSEEMGRSFAVHGGIAQGIVDLGGAAWDPQSAGLGEVGTTILFGHRVSHGGPFRTVSSLGPGDTLSLTGSDGRIYLYAVVGTRITQPTWEAIQSFQPPSGKGLTLVACHPLGSTAQRFVVDADLVAVS